MFSKNNRQEYTFMITVRCDTSLADTELGCKMELNDLAQQRLDFSV